MPLVNLILDATNPNTDFGAKIYNMLNDPNVTDGDLLTFVNNNGHSDIKLGEIISLLAHYRNVKRKEPEGTVIVPKY